MKLSIDKRRLQAAISWLFCVLASVALVAILAAPKAYARDIIVGQSLDLSGQSNLGKDFSNGIRTYFDAINAKGGVRGRKILFLQLDDSGEPKETVANLTKLRSENDLDVLIAPTTAQSFIAAVADLSEKRSNLTLFGAPTGARPANTDAARVLNVRASYADEARQMLNHMATMSLGNVALVRGEGEEAAFAAQAFREEARKRNLKLVFDGDTTLWRSRSAQNASLEAVAIAGDAIGVAPALAHARATARNANLFGFSTIDHRTLLELSKTAAIGMIISQAMPSADKTVHPFQREHRALMKQYRDEPPSLHTLEGYVVARVLVGALEAIDGDPTAVRVSSALRSLRDIDLGPMSVSTRIATNAVRFVNLSAVSKRGALIE
jgi:branched-chain amino acid transport system substrate-binding protein